MTVIFTSIYQVIVFWEDHLLRWRLEQGERKGNVYIIRRLSWGMQGWGNCIIGLHKGIGLNYYVLFQWRWQWGCTKRCTDLLLWAQWNPSIRIWYATFTLFRWKDLSYCFHMCTTIDTTNCLQQLYGIKKESGHDFFGAWWFWTGLVWFSSS